MKRLLDCDTSDINSMSKEEKLYAISASEGRILMQELSLFHNMQLLEPISDAEIACAFGADMLLLNAFDVYQPHIPGILASSEEIIQQLKNLTGRMIGVNLEPVKAVQQTETKMSKGRMACKETVCKAKALGFDFIVLTGNPGTGVNNQRIIEVLEEISDVKEDLIIIAGKMHAAGELDEAGEDMMTNKILTSFVKNGADVILLPAPGSVPGISVESTRELIRQIHKVGKLSLTAIGTSQEGSDEGTIRQLAMNCKMAGSDIHHIGDAALGGMHPENLMSYSICIRGKRHTYLRMARSINR